MTTCWPEGRCWSAAGGHRRWWAAVFVCTLVAIILPFLVPAFVQPALAAPAPTITGLSAHNGDTAGGSSVIITGTNFTGATSVTFGGIAATTFTVDSDTQITATTAPQDNGSGRVVVTTPGGSNPDTAADDYTYVDTTATIAVSDFANYRVFQRDIGGTSKSVTVSGTYSNMDWDHLEARVLQDGTSTAVIDWTTIDSTPGGGTFSGNLSVPQGGWYNVEVRALDGEGSVLGSSRGTNKWGVGMIILVIGQSNMSGRGQPPYAIATSDLAVNYSNAGRWEHLADPYDDESPAGAVDDDDAKAAGSMIPGIANSLLQSFDFPIAFVPAAKGGSNLWVNASNYGWAYRNPSNHFDTSTLYGQSITKAQSVGGVELIIMHQGEQDLTDGRTEANYEADFSTMIGHYRQDLYSTIPIFICQLGTVGSGSDGGATGIRNAQHDVDNGTSIFMGATAMDLPRMDTWHYTTPALTVLGGRLANAIKYYYGQSTYYRGPSVNSAFLSDGNRNQVIVTLNHRGGTDITPATGITGFGVFDNGSSVTIQSAVRYAPDAVLLTLASSIAAGHTVTLRYLYGMTPNVSGLVKDNSPLSLPLENTTADVPVDQSTYVAPPTVTAVSPTSGPTTGGTSVTITGTGFTGATSVSFGGTAAGSFTVNTATQITATAPAHAAGIADVVVTIPGGGASATSSADRFTFVAAPTVTSLNPTSGSAAGGTSVMITGTNLIGATAVTFGGTAAAITANTATSITATTPAHTVGAVSVAVTTAGGTATLANGYTYVTPTTRVDATSTNTALYYSGTWADYSTTSAYGGSYRRSSTSGAYVVIAFKGTQLDWVTMKGTTGGIADIYVDGSATKTATINLYASPAVYQQNLFSTGTLPDGYHTVKIVRDAASASGSYVTVDAVDVAGSLVPALRVEENASPSPFTWNPAFTSWTTGTTTSASGGTYKYINTAGAYLSFSFTGVGFKIIAKTGPSYGNLTVTIDGVSQTVSLYSAATTYKKVVLTAFRAPGTHTVKISRAGTKSSSSTGYTIDIDAIDLFGVMG